MQLRVILEAEGDENPVSCGMQKVSLDIMYEGMFNRRNQLMQK